MVNREFERRRLKVYLAGPISKGDVWENIYRGLQVGRRMLFDGLAPYIPHLDAYLTLQPNTPPDPTQSNWNALLEWDLEWVASSDAFYRLAGESKGADLEMEVAESLGIPVFNEEQFESAYAALLAYAETRGLRGKRRYEQ